MILPRSALLLPLWLAAPALAEPRSERLLDLLSYVPAGQIESDPGAWGNIWFADFQAAADTLQTLPPEADPVRLGAWGPWARVYLPDLSDIVMHGLEGNWEPLVGFGPFDVEAGLVMGRTPDTATLLLLDPAAMEQVVPALLAHDFLEQTQGGLTALVRGEEDYGISIRDRDPGDPFRGSLGASSRVVLDDALLVHARGWPTLLRLLDDREQKGHPDLPALAAALDLPDWGDTALLQAFFLPHQLELGEPGSGGPPPWRLGMVADLGSGIETVTLALFTYTSRAEAEAAAQQLGHTWDEPIPSAFNDIVLEQLAAPGAAASPPKPSLQDITQAEAQTGVAGEGPFVTWLAVRSPTQASGARLRNQPFEVLWQALMRRELGHFGAP